MNVIRERTEELELKMAEGHVLSKREVFEKGFSYFTGLGAAANQGYYTVRVCKNMGQPVTIEEFTHIQYYAMYMSCYQHNCLVDHSKSVRPCIPVFYREKPDK